MTSLRFVVPGPPVPLERARKGKEGRWYTPARSTAYKAAVRFQALGAVLEWETDHQCAWDMWGPFILSVALYFPDERARDADNVLKAIKDACTGKVWGDDKWTVIPAGKWSCELARNRPRAEVMVEVIE